MGKQHIIELNGRRYDALTGRQLSGPAKTQTHHSSAHRSLDGFASPKNHPPRRVSSTAHAPHHPEKSKTLMRHTLPKPAAQAQHPVKKTKHVNSQPSTLPSLEVASLQPPRERLTRAKHTVQSRLIKHFGAEVASTPSHALMPPAAALQAESTSAIQQADPLAEALAKATAHKQPKVKRPSARHRIAKRLRITPRILNAGALSLALLLVVGFFAYQNIPNLAMRVASMRARVDGSLPSYNPSGFSISGAIQYQPGQIVVGYKSNTDERYFNITQRASEWDSQSLLQQYVSPKNQPYQTIQDKGKTVYLYEGNNATWVDGGIWYTIEGDSKLNSDQLLDLASSL